ncbi:MAG: type I-A CRISPR-associated protein Cas7/Csa2 [Candidatus Korarchaeum sp.]
MSDPFVSIRGRVLINVEALNMTESVGNYVKHRRVPVIMPGSYATYFAPAVSGESIAHGYQQVLAEVAMGRGIPVCKLCSKGYFLKSSNDNVFRESFGTELPESEGEFERVVIKNCVVEDVGGFLYAPRGGGKNVKRTSNFFVGYMVPVREALENVVIEPQLHARYALGTPFVERGGRVGGQMIYYVELASAVYTFSFDLDTKYIGKATFTLEGRDDVVVDNRRERIEASLDALYKFMTEMLFGAKRTRFLPIIEWESLVVAVSDDIWTVLSPFSKKYIDNTIKKVDKLDYNTKLFMFIESEEKYRELEGKCKEEKEFKEMNKEEKSKVKCVIASDFEDTLKMAIDEAKNRLNQRKAEGGSREG